MTEITQADREAAAQYDVVEAFARHREQAAAEERAKIVAYGLGEKGAAWSRDVQQFIYAIEAKEHLK